MCGVRRFHPLVARPEPPGSGRAAGPSVGDFRVGCLPAPVPWPLRPPGSLPSNCFRPIRTAAVWLRVFRLSVDGPPINSQSQRLVGVPHRRSTMFLGLARLQGGLLAGHTQKKKGARCNLNISWMMYTIVQRHLNITPPNGHSLHAWASTPLRVVKRHDKACTMATCSKHACEPTYRV